MKKSGINFVFRVPLIPGITDTEENLRAISQIVGDCPVVLLRYNALAGAKYEMLDMAFSLGKRENRAEDFTRFFRNARME